MLKNLRPAVRLLTRHWVFTLTAAAILALCLGVNVAVLSVVSAWMLRPLPYPEQGRLAAVVRAAAVEGAQAFGESHTGATWEAIRDGGSAIDAAVYAGGTTGVNLAIGHAARYVRQQRVSAGFFRVLGVGPALGREFTQAEDVAAGPPVAILSHTLWRNTFSGDPQIVGRDVLLRGEPYRVVGIMPAGFQPLAVADVWTPLRPSRSGEGGGTNYRILARLKPSTGWVEANAQLAGLSAADARERGLDPARASRLQVVPLREATTEDIRRPVLLLWAAVAAVFLIGCVNIGGMLLARSTARAGEVATRLALGAGGHQIVGQLMTESLILAVLGGAAAVPTGLGALAALRAVGSESFPILDSVTLDWPVLAATFLLALGGSVLFGLLPALQAGRVDLRAVLGSRTVAGRRHFVPLGLLVGGQVALTVPLLLSAGLLLRTFSTLWSADPGFNPEGVVTARFSLEDARYASAERTQQLLSRAVRELEQIPGIDAAAASLSMPYERALNMPFSRVADTSTPQRPSITNMTYVTPSYFAALQIPRLQGRTFEESDGPASLKVTVVNDAFAALYFRERPAIGELLRVGRDTLQIVGIVGSVQQRRAGWGNFGPVAPVPNLYVPVAQVNAGFLKLVHTWFSPSWIVRTARPPSEAIVAIEQTMRRIDPQLPIAGFRTIDELKSESLAQQRLLAGLVGTIGGLAFGLSALGLYGLLANLVAERRRELGIRMALGSTVREAIATAIRPGALWVAAGLVAGCVVSLSAVRLVVSFLWGVEPLDPATLGGVALGVVAMTLAASAIPAWRVLRLSPAETLRGE